MSDLVGTQIVGFLTHRLILESLSLSLPLTIGLASHNNQNRDSRPQILGVPKIATSLQFDQLRTYNPIAKILIVVIFERHLAYLRNMLQA